MRVCTHDNVIVELPVEFQDESRLISDMKNVIEDTSDEPIPLAIQSDILQLMIDYCTKIKSEGISDCVIKTFDDLDQWEQDFMSLENSIIIALTEAANYIDMQRLYKACILKICNLVQGKTYNEIQQILVLK
jgi:hypothetical protein